MNAELLGIIATFALTLALAIPLGKYIGKVYAGERTLMDPIFNPIEKLFFKVSGMAHYFSGYQCYGTKGNPKAENIKDIVIDYQLTAPVYIGDTLGDFESATKAGVPFIFADYGFGNVESGQIATISSLYELIALL